MRIFFFPGVGGDLMGDKNASEYSIYLSVRLPEKWLTRDDNDVLSEWVSE